MSTLPRTPSPPIGLGILSMVLGAIGLLLFFLPILGWPISAFGMFFGLVGSVVAFPAGGTRLRWSLLGCGICALALGVNLGISYAPGGYLPAPQPPSMWQSVPDRPWVSPPAHPGRVR